MPQPEHHLFDQRGPMYTYLSSDAQFSLVKTNRTFQTLRMRKHAHMSREGRPAMLDVRAVVILVGKLREERTGSTAESRSSLSTAGNFVAA
ncbi:hypothetical protein YC2023_060911 [Brassica napus]